MTKKKPENAILRRLRYPNDLIAAVVPMVARHMQFMNVKQMRTAKLKRFMAEPTFPQEMELHRVDCGSSNGFTDNYEFLQAKAEEFAAEPLIPPPLGLGNVELADGSWVTGFICEGHALDSAQDVTPHGGWRAYIGSLSE